MWRRISCGREEEGMESGDRGGGYGQEEEVGRVVSAGEAGVRSTSASRKSESEADSSSAASAVSRSEAEAEEGEREGSGGVVEREEGLDMAGGQEELAGLLRLGG